MNEQEWLAATDAQAMFAYLRGPTAPWPSRWFPWSQPRPSSISNRKGRLLVLAWMQRTPELAAHPLLRLFTDWADGKLGVADAGSMGDLLNELRTARQDAEAFELLLHRVGGMMLQGETCLLATLPMMRGQPEACDLFREVFGNPFRPTQVEPRWLEWNAGAAHKLAARIGRDGGYEELPLLADLLAEAGCDDAVILSHLRQGTGHVRGCWAIDLLLGKE